MADAIASVQASASRERARPYQQDVDVDLGMAVLIQEVVAATAGGLAFSRDPRGGDKRVTVESSFGLGKAVVDGEVTPDRHQLSHSGVILEKKCGRKLVRFDVDDRGLRREQLGPSTEFALSDDRAMEIAKLCVRVERQFGYPADIEWAVDAKDRTWLLQVRPITSLVGTNRASFRALPTSI